MTENNAEFILNILNKSHLSTAIYQGEDLRIIYANQAMMTLWCANQTVIGKPLTVAFPHFQEEGFVRILQNVWKTGTPYIASNTVAHIVDGPLVYKRYFDFEYKPICNDQEEVIAILNTAVDVTRQKDAIKTIEEQKLKLSFNNELEIITHTLAHDAKNPISIARLAVSHLQQMQDLENENLKKWYGLIDDAISSLNSIIDKTVQLSKAKSYEIAQNTINMEVLLRKWIDEASILYNKPPETVVMGQFLALKGDVGAIYLIFSNIIGNAFKYTPKDSTARIEIYSETTSKGVVYYVKDNGIGIPTQEVNSIFLNFHRASNSQDHYGKGNGLYIVKKILDSINGNINIMSKLDKGTKVRLFFPYPTN